MTPLTIVTWKWKPARNYRSEFTSEHVNVLASMVKRHYKHPHRVVCVTDDPVGINPSIGIIPLWPDLSDLINPHGAHQPSCYRRLKAFSAEARDWFGDRFVSLDLDCVIVGDMAPLWNRPEEFIIWGSGTDRRVWCNGSMWMMTAGARKQVWETFNPKTSPGAAKRSGFFGSDQGWIAHCLGRKEAMWTIKDGVYSFRVHLNGGSKQLPSDARVVFFHGKYDPWSAHCMNIPWIAESYN
jgi:diadenosine tetraphosphatase ApaH/serine/threonine PP2A family protein phosphatase